MLNNIRNFAKTKYAGVLVGILIVPFVLWGMGGLFSGGNKNNLAKINNENISTQDFQNYLNIKNIPLENIKKNIDNNIIEEMLGELISIKMLDMEINNLKLIISDKGLNKIIKTNRNFVDENNKFSRVKYEKFLLSANMTAPSFESRLKQEELKRALSLIKFILLRARISTFSWDFYIHPGAILVARNLLADKRNVSMERSSTRP